MIIPGKGECARGETCIQSCGCKSREDLQDSVNDRGNIKMDIKENGWGGMDLRHLICQEREQRRVFVNMVTNLMLP
jgi:hypothetical protein